MKSCQVDYTSRNIKWDGCRQIQIQAVKKKKKKTPTEENLKKSQSNNSNTIIQHNDVSHKLIKNFTRNYSQIKKYWIDQASENVYAHIKGSKGICSRFYAIIISIFTGITYYIYQILPSRFALPVDLGLLRS